jgi:hypothetical protein
VKGEVSPQASGKEDALAQLISAISFPQAYSTLTLTLALHKEIKISHTLSLSPRDKAVAQGELWYGIKSSQLLNAKQSFLQKQSNEGAAELWISLI